MTRPARSALHFGWTYDHGELVVAPEHLPRAVHEVLDDAGFDYRGDAAGSGAWCMGFTQEWNQLAQSDAARSAVTALVAAGEDVRNWHLPHHRSADVVRHYAWLTSTAPFPDAAATARSTRTEARRRLTQSTDRAALGLTAEIANGELLVEARRTLGTAEWMIASERDRPGHYLELGHTLATGTVFDTGRWTPPDAGELRRTFRQVILRHVAPPKQPRSPRAAAAAALGRRPVPAPLQPTVVEAAAQVQPQLGRRR